MKSENYVLPVKQGNIYVFFTEVDSAKWYLYVYLVQTEKKIWKHLTQISGTKKKKKKTEICMEGPWKNQTKAKQSFIYMYIYRERERTEK